jgi:streptogramin lyase
MKCAVLVLFALVLGNAAEQKVKRPGVPGVQVKLETLKRAFTYQLGGSPDWMALTDEAVWVSNSRLKAVQRIDPKTDTVAAKVDLPGEPCSGLATGFGSLWVPLCGNSSGVARVDLSTNKIIAVIPGSPAESEGGITAGADAVWIVMSKALLTKIDPSANRAVGTVPLPSGSSNPLYSDGLIWVTGFTTNQLVVVDPSKGAVTGKIPTGPGPRFLTKGGGSLWTLNQGDGTVTRVEASSQRAIATIAAGIPGTGGEIAYGADSVWTTVFDIPLTRIDPQSNQVVKQWAGFGGDSVRFGFGSIWLTDLRHGLLWRIDQSDVIRQRN